MKQKDLLCTEVLKRKILIFRNASASWGRMTALVRIKQWSGGRGYSEKTDQETRMKVFSWPELLIKVLSAVTSHFNSLSCGIPCPRA